MHCHEYVSVLTSEDSVAFVIKAEGIEMNEKNTNESQTLQSQNSGSTQ